MDAMPIPVGACEVWFQYQIVGDNEPMYTHLAYDTTTVPTQSAIDAGFTAWQTAFKAITTGDSVLVGGHVLIGSDPGTVRWESSISPVVGVIAGLNVPQNTAFLARKQTNLGGRRNRGRMYIPGVPESWVTGAGVVPIGNVGDINTALGKLLVGGLIHTAFGFLGQPVLLHQSGSQTPTEIVDLQAQRIVATQRRRLRR